jgi:hypothetical protein
MPLLSSTPFRVDEGIAAAYRAMEALPEDATPFHNDPFNANGYLIRSARLQGFQGKKWKKFMDMYIPWDAYRSHLQAQGVYAPGFMEAMDIMDQVFDERFYAINRVPRRA